MQPRQGSKRSNQRVAVGPSRLHMASKRDDEHCQAKHASLLVPSSLKQYFKPLQPATANVARRDAFLTTAANTASIKFTCKNLEPWRLTWRLHARLSMPNFDSRNGQLTLSAMQAEVYRSRGPHAVCVPLRDPKLASTAAPCGTSSHTSHQCSCTRNVVPLQSHIAIKR